MVEQKVQITHSQDHEFELATMIVQTASCFSSKLSIAVNNKRVNAKSMMGLMYLELMDDDEVTITAEGADETGALKSLVELLHR